MIESIDGPSGAVFSDDRVYRYCLWRRWQFGGPASQSMVMFVGLNPSTADETQDDPTIRRCIGFAKEWGYGGVIMANLFAFRATKPAEMKAAADPVGPDNDRWLERLQPQVAVTVAAWGAHGSFRNRSNDFAIFCACPVYCLSLTKSGEPGHPLFLPKTCTPHKWLYYA